MKRFVASERRAVAMYVGAMFVVLATGLAAIALHVAGVISTGDINAAVVTGLFIGGGAGVMFAILALKTEETDEAA